MGNKKSKVHKSYTTQVNKAEIQTTAENVQKTVSDVPSTSLSADIQEEFTVVGKQHIVCLDTSIEETSVEFQETLTKHRYFDFDLKKFTDVENCIEHLKSTGSRTIFLIVSDAFDDNTLSLLHGIESVYTMFIFCKNEVLDREWMKEQTKTAKAFTSIDFICNALIKIIKEQVDETMPMTFISKQEILDARLDQSSINRLEPSFMYSALFKEILLEINEEESNAVKQLAAYCRRQGICEAEIDQFECSYQDKSPIWFYSKDIFLYKALNNALRSLDMECMTKMGFFIRSLHCQLERLHHEQLDNHKNPFTVYRGQAFFQNDFQKLQNSKGGLLFVNNFLSTSLDPKVAMSFIEDSVNRSHDKIGVFMIMKIDLNKVSASMHPLASIEGYIVFQNEREILFSTHTVFLIEDIQENTDKRIWNVHLTLTDNMDPQLAELANRTRRELSGSTGWHRLGDLLIRVGSFNQAEELYNELLKNSTDDSDRAHIYHRLGWVKSDQGHYYKAVEFYEKALDISMKNINKEDSKICSYYNSLALAYNKLGEYSKAINFYNRNLSILQNTLPPKNHELAIVYINLGLVYAKLGKYEEALESHYHGNEILKTTLLPNHPELASSYDNIGAVYDEIGDYHNVREFYEKSCKIRELSLPAKHPDLASSYSNIGLAYKHMGNYSDALKWLEKAREIFVMILHPNHADLATVYNNIGNVYGTLNDYVKAREFYEYALKIREYSLPSNHSDLATSYNNIGQVYKNMGEYSKALEYYEKDLEITKNSLSSDHLSLATSYDNIGDLYKRMGDYAKALDFSERALEIRKSILKPIHADLTMSHLNFAACYEGIGDYTKALKAVQTALHIRQQLEVESELDLLSYCLIYNWKGNVYRSIKNYTKALNYYEKCLKTAQNIYPEAHSQYGILYGNIGDIYTLMDNYKMALDFLLKAMNIQETAECDSLERGKIYLYLGKTYLGMKNYSAALEYFEKALQIRQNQLPKDHPDLAVIHYNMAKLYLTTEKYTLAMENAQQAVEIAEKKLPTSHPHLLDYRETLKQIQKL